MTQQDRLLQNLSDLFNVNDTTALIDPSYLPVFSSDDPATATLKAQSQWFGAIAALETLLLSTNEDQEALILSGPTGLLSHPQLVKQVRTGIFTPEALKSCLLSPFQLPSADASPYSEGEITELPLFPQDPISQEPFCLAFTKKFGLLMVLGEDSQGNPHFHFSFDPDLLQQGWKLLRSRLQLTHHPQLSYLDEIIERINSPEPDYRLVIEFSRQLLHHLPEIPSSARINYQPTKSVETIVQEVSHPEKLTSDVELLQALTHEVRTPLTTIRTMTQLLLKRGKLTPQMQKCLEVIDQECTEQIDRMELIFQATELETPYVEKKTIQLVPISLDQIFTNSIPRWQKQAQRRNIKLDIQIPPILPQIISDPSRLDQILGGLMEKVTRNLPSGGEVQIQVSTAGNQLKLEVSSPSNYFHNPFKALGQLLLFQPDTGSLCLNLDVTKNLFQALGGKLIVRQKPSQKGEIFTVFLPVKKMKPN
jgi:signal transduction histidine kinase